MYKNRFLIACFAIGLVTNLYAQEVQPISKSEVFNKVSEANHKIKISVEAFNEAKADSLNRSIQFIILYMVLFTRKYIDT